EFNDLSHIDSNSLFDGDTTPKGAAPANSSNYPNPARLIDDVVHTICTGFAGQQTDQTVTLQILKVLLTFVTSDTCQVHGISLLKVIQTCCNIYCFTRNAILQATAKAELTQMANLIVTRCEEYAVQLENYETSKKAVKNNNEQNEEENSKKRNSVEVENATGKQETPQAYVVAESNSKPVESDKSEDLINHKKNGSNDSAVEWADATESPTGDVVDSVVIEKRVAIEADEAPEPEQ
ncbi:9257_t:CDS:1, partial [Paraglomus occultum]